MDQIEDSFDPMQNPLDIPPAEANRIVMQYKEKHYADWPNHPLPALNGQTPQQAARTKVGREQLDLLLKDLENHEARMPPGQQYDVSKLRKMLGLPLK